MNCGQEAAEARAGATAETTARSARPHLAQVLAGVLLWAGGCSALGPPGDSASQGASGDGRSPLSVVIDVPAPPGGGGPGTMGTIAPIGAAALDMDPSVLSFGTTCPGGTRQQVLTLRNTGTADLAIRGLSLSNKDFALVAAPASPVSIRPGGDLRLRLRFTAPVGLLDAFAADGTLLIDSNVGDAPVSVSLHARVAAGIVEVSRSRLDFGAQGMAHAVSQALLLRNTGECPVEVSGWEVSGKGSPGIDLALPPAPLRAGQSQQVNVTLLCHSPGEVDVELRLQGQNGVQVAASALTGLCS